MCAYLVYNITIKGATFSSITEISARKHLTTTICSRIHNNNGIACAFYSGYGRFVCSHVLRNKSFDHFINLESLPKKPLPSIFLSIVNKETQASFSLIAKMPGIECARALSTSVGIIIYYQIWLNAIRVIINIPLIVYLFKSLFDAE